MIGIRYWYNRTTWSKYPCTCSLSQYIPIELLSCFIIFFLFWKKTSMSGIKYNQHTWHILVLAIKKTRHRWPLSVSCLANTRHISDLVQVLPCQICVGSGTYIDKEGQWPMFCTGLTSGTDGYYESALVPFSIVVLYVFFQQKRIL